MTARRGSASVKATEPPREARDAPPLVSVILPAYNSEGFIAGALESVFQQSYPRWELIVIDDGSRDPQALDAVLAPYGERVHLIRQANAGVSAARNAGLRAASGHYVAFLDSDDGWEPSYLTAQVSILEADPSLTLVYCDATFRGDASRSGRTAMQLSPSTGEPDLLALVSLRCMVLTSSTVVRREPVMAAGGFDATLAVSEDFDLWLRLLLRGGRFTYHTQPLGWRQVRPGSLSADPLRMARAGVAILQSHAPTMPETPEIQAAVASTIRRLRGAEALVLGKHALLGGNHPVAQRELASAKQALGGPRLSLASWLVQRVPAFTTASYRVVARYRGE